MWFGGGYWCSDSEKRHVRKALRSWAELQYVPFDEMIGEEHTCITPQLPLHRPPLFIKFCIRGYCAPYLHIHLLAVSVHDSDSDSLCLIIIKNKC